MDSYDFRGLYTPKLLGLQLRNYQFDRMIEEQYPAIARHFKSLDIRSSMYASQVCPFKHVVPDRLCSGS